MGNFLNRLFGFVAGFFKTDGNLSSQRAAFLLSVVISNLAIFGVWIVLSYINKTIVPINESILVLYGLANGISVTSKLIQTKLEDKNQSIAITEDPQEKESAK